MSLTCALPRRPIKADSECRARRIGAVNRSLLTPRWLLLHLLFAAAVVATGLLAWWQWDRAHGVGGTLQNLGYAFQWPMFGAFAVFLWYRLTIGDTKRAPADTHRPSQGKESVAGPESPVQDTPGQRRRPLVPPPAAPVTEDEDPELAAYNRYLAQLNRTEPNETQRGRPVS